MDKRFTAHTSSDADRSPRWAPGQRSSTNMEKKRHFFSHVIQSEGGPGEGRDAAALDEGCAAAALDEGREVSDVCDTASAVACWTSLSMHIFGGAHPRMLLIVFSPDIRNAGARREQSMQTAFNVKHLPPPKSSAL